MDIICVLISALLISIGNPMLMIVVLLILSVLSSIILLLNFIFSWVPYLLVLILAGAVLILFAYLASLLPNYNSVNWGIIWVFPVGLYLELNISDSSYSFISEFPLIIVLFMAIYLLLAVTIATYMIRLTRGPLRSI